MSGQDRILKVGIVGAAGRGNSFFVPFDEHPSVQITALCDTNAEALADIASKRGVDNRFTDYEEMLDKAGLDAVIIGTPMPLHASQSIAALERDIHVLCEIPAVVTMDEAPALVRAVADSQATYMMAENCLYIRNNVLVNQIARAGLFGETYHAEGEYLHELKGLNEITKWRRKWQSGINGCTYPTHSLGPPLQWMDDRVVGVSCSGSGHHYKDAQGRPFEQEDSITMMCRTSRGGQIRIRVDMLSNRPENPAYYSLQGTEGSFETGRSHREGDDPVIWLTSRIDHFEWMPLSKFEEEFLPPEWLNMPERIRNSAHWGGDYMLAQDFINSVLNEVEPAVDVHRALDMTLPGLISQQSIQQGSAWLPVPDSRDWDQQQ